MSMHTWANSAYVVTDSWVRQHAPLERQALEDALAPMTMGQFAEQMALASNVRDIEHERPEEETGEEFEMYLASLEQLYADLTDAIEERTGLDVFLSYVHEDRLDLAVDTPEVCGMFWWVCNAVEYTKAAEPWKNDIVLAHWTEWG